ncbi:cutinase family protein [Gordonia rhizosphera]|uniref:Uncharacterized protein n=1 Tax=Gordonia rhizosphera NBRC 16068 TaxID=1108045 RepID=K6VPE3_9ACTN|nr:PE-PPE domain-containing protein [Gordonia rhizosphera]GAB88765.1 hypothetical protein GORHZ_039_00130 [Gordonia rhizosphera NBRC 16068]
MTTRTRFSRRLSLTLVASFSTVSIAATFCLPGLAGIARAVECGAGAVVIVGGTGDPEGAIMSGVAQRYSLGADGIPNTADDYEVIYVDYPATVWPSGAAGYDDSTAQGTAATKDAIATYQHSCDKPVVVAGYSQGARIAGDVLSDIGNDRDDTVTITDEQGNPVEVDISADNVSGELYSDPRQNGDKTGEGIELALIGVIPGLTMSGPRDGGFGSLEGSVISVCVDGDPICDLPDPLYDPIGAVDGLIGYWVKHGLYPAHMRQEPNSPSWGDRPVVCTDNICMVAYDSAVVEQFRIWAADLGYAGTIDDFLANRLTFNWPLGIELSNPQPAVRFVQGLFPPLPKLGYGAYLPDLTVFEDILNGIVTISPDQLKDGVTALAASAESIVLQPVNFVGYWGGTVLGVDTGAAGPDLGPTRIAIRAQLQAWLDSQNLPSTTVSTTNTLSLSSAPTTTEMPLQVTSDGDASTDGTPSGRFGSEQKDAVAAKDEAQENEAPAGSIPPAGGNTNASEPEPIRKLVPTESAVDSSASTPDNLSGGGGTPTGTASSNTGGQGTEGQGTEGQDIDGQDTDSQDTDGQNTDSPNTDGQDTKGQNTRANNTGAGA